MANQTIASPTATQSIPEPVVEARTVAAGRGLSWWVEAWRLFTPSVGPWIIVAVILCALALIASAASLIPVIGQLLALAGEILWPVLIGGLMLGCRAIDRGNPLLVAHLFAGFSQRTGPLIVAGAIYTGILIVISLAIGGMMVALFGVSILSVLMGSADPSQTGVAFSSAVVAVLLGFLFFLLLLVPLLMAIWFAPPLIMLAGLEPIAAMKASFGACVRNVVPFLVYGLIGLVLMVVATLPFGVGWIVLAPVMVASIYASYCDIFEDRDNL
jgi:uncharacterized membrane protein